MAETMILDRQSVGMGWAELLLCRLSCPTEPRVSRLDRELIRAKLHADRLAPHIGVEPHHDGVIRYESDTVRVDI